MPMDRRELRGEHYSRINLLRPIAGANPRAFLWMMLLFTHWVSYKSDGSEVGALEMLQISPTRRLSTLLPSLLYTRILLDALEMAASSSSRRLNISNRRGAL